MKILLIALMVIGGCAITGNTTRVPSETHFNYTVLFCDKDGCLNELIRQINNAAEVSCALYNLDRSVVYALERNTLAAIVTDSNAKIDSSLRFKRKSSGLMHNKFCVFDRKIVWTGSFNPTKAKSLDSVIVINSSWLAKNYLEEFEELKSNNSIKTTTTKIILNTTIVENYFCPEDNCINILQNKLATAEKSIYFAAYSFTHPKIANELIVKNSGGVAVRGIIEKGSKYSQFQTLKSNGLEVVEDSKKQIFHHKFFVIDERIVITGSFNPTRNGDTRNDENILIIHDEELAQVYLSYIENFLG